MFGTKTLIEKLNTAINSGSLTEIELAQAFGAIESLEKHPVSSVTSTADLPNPVTNKGRFIWIEAERRYVYSNGVAWDINSIVVIPYINLWSWGNNLSGRLGDNTSVTRSSPVSIVGGFTDWVQVSAGGPAGAHSLAIRADGTAWAWGSNSGSLGDNSITARSSPVSVVGGFTDWVQVSAGTLHSLGVRANGTAWAWGNNGSGRLGDNTTVGKSSPVSVVGGFTDWVELKASWDSSIGLRANGTAWAWGNNLGGRLGDGTIVGKSSPVSVVGGFTDWKQLSTARYHNVGVRADGTAWGWGNGATGRLGDGTTVGKSSPVSVVGGFTDWVQVSAGSSHNLGLRANGTAWAWGGNTLAQIGDGTTTNSFLSPVSVVGGFTDWITVDAGDFHNLAIRANGTAWAWGYAPSGRLGDGTTTSRRSPVSVVGGFTDWVQIDAGAEHSLGIRG